MKTYITIYIIFLLVSLLFGLLLLGGCSDTGFDKKATLMPDRIGVSFGQQHYKTKDSAWRGFDISAQ